MTQSTPHSTPMLHDPEGIFQGNLDDSALQNLLADAEKFTNTEQYTFAESLYKNILRSHENVPEACIGLAEISLRLKNYDATILYANEALKKNPTKELTARAVAFMALGFLGVGNIIKGQACLSQVLSLSPRTSKTWCVIGAVYEALKNFLQGAKAFEKALELAPTHYHLYSNISRMYSLMEDTKASLRCTEEWLKVCPNHHVAHSNMGAIQGILGNRKEALYYYRKAIACNPDFLKAYAQLVNVDGLNLPEDQYIVDKLEESIKLPALTKEDRIACGFALATIYRKNKEHDKAFLYYKEANDLKYGDGKRTLIYPDMEPMHDLFTETFCTRYRRTPEEKHSSLQPIFIIGMPRSGTTLTEQILSCHSLVHGTGERLFFANLMKKLNITHSLNYIEFFRNATPETLAQIREDYLKEIGSLPDGCTYFVDKMPTNFLFLGMIKMVFPEAIIIHCMRHPLDNGISIYFQNFEFRNEFSDRLEDIAHFHRVYAKLMKLWHRCFPGEIFDLPYELMVSNQEPLSRKLLEFCGLKWEDNCLDFHKNKKEVRTASIYQVRQPIYTSSAGRWKRYEKHISMLIEGTKEETKEYESMLEQTLNG